MDERKERRLLVVRRCMLFVVLAGWTIYFGYLFSVHRVVGTDFWGIVGSVFLPSLLVLAGSVIVCGLAYLIYRTALIKIR